jgi:hypothetical protein
MLFKDLKDGDTFMFPIRGSGDASAVSKKIKPLGRHNSINYGAYSQSTGIITLRYSPKDEEVDGDREVTPIELTVKKIAQ